MYNMDESNSYYESNKKDIVNTLKDHILKKTFVVKYRNEMIDMVMRQTCYTYEETILKLARFNYNHIMVIQDYLKPIKERIQEEKDKDTKINVQQDMMRQIRNFMDNVSSQYEKRKEYEELRKSQAQ